MFLKGIHSIMELLIIGYMCVQLCPNLFPKAAALVHKSISGV